MWLMSEQCLVSVTNLKDSFEIILCTYVSSDITSVVPNSGASSLRPDESSLHGSTVQLAGSSITTDSTLEMKKEAEDPHLSATLPRDQAPTYQYMSANALSGRHPSSGSDDSGQGYFSGRSQSQPLETAM